MKHLKTFESKKDHKNEFNVGDIVKCIHTGNSIFLEIGNIYTIANVDRIDHEYQIEEALDDYPGHGYRKRCFILATPEEIEIYKMKKDTDKYNL